MLREYLDLSGRKWQEDGEDCIMRSFIFCTHHQILLGSSNQGEWEALGEPLWRPQHRWECNVRLDLRETGWEVMGWIHLFRDRDQWRILANTV